MCGIIGYIGNKEKKEVVLDGLRELEYRGYDSAGISILSNDVLSTFKTTGKLIPKERLLRVPHATECIEAKEARK